MPTVVIISTVVILFENLMEKNLSIAKKVNKSNIGYMAGYISKAAINSPFIKRREARWRPQPGQSKPNNFLEKHGSI